MNIYYQVLLSGMFLLLLDGLYLYNTKENGINQMVIIQKEEVTVKLLGVILCYIFLIIGINYFIINEKKSIYEAFLLGSIIYGVYDSTNYALFKNWSFGFMIQDTLWGGTVFALTTKIMYLFNN